MFCSSQWSTACTCCLDSLRGICFRPSMTIGCPVLGRRQTYRRGWSLECHWISSALTAYLWREDKSSDSRPLLWSGFRCRKLRTLGTQSNLLRVIICSARIFSSIWSYSRYKPSNVLTQRVSNQSGSLSQSHSTSWNNQQNCSAKFWNSNTNCMW